GATPVVKLGSALGAGEAANPLAATRSISLNGNVLQILDGNGAGNAIASFNGTGDVVGLNNTAVGTNNIGFAGGTNTVNGITNINTGATYNLTTIGNGAGVGTNTALTIN